MIRWIVALALATGLLLCETTAADPPSGGIESAKIAERLDQVLRRLSAIEQRLAQLEVESLLTTEWRVDEYGVVRSGSGRPIGFWGIDGPVANPRR